MSDTFFDEVPIEPLENKRDFIFQLPIFAGLRHLPAKRDVKGTPARNFLKICREMAFDAGAIIAEDEDYANHLYIVRTGQLEALEVTYVNNEQVFKRLRLYNPGDHFGDEWLFRPATHRALVRARKSGRLVIIKSDDFINFVKTYPKALQIIHPYLSLECKRIIQTSRFQEYLRSSNTFELPFGKKPPPQAVEVPEAQEEEEAAASDSGFTPKRDQMQRIRKLGLLPDEYIEYYSNRSRTILGFRMALSLFVTAVLFGFPFWLLQGSGLTLQMAVVIASLFAIVPLGDMVRYWINWRNLFFVITNRRIIRSELLVFRFRNKVEKIDINKVQTVNSKKDGLINNMLNIGTAEITTAAQSAVLYFDFINNPEQVEAAIQKIREAEKQIGKSRVKAAMRSTVDSHFKIDSGVREIKEEAPPPARKPWLVRMREEFVQEVVGGTVIYHKHPIALVRAEIGPMVMAVIMLVVLYVGVSFFREVLNLAEIGVYVLLVIANLLWAWWQFEDWHNDTFQITTQYIYDVDRRPLGFGEDRKVAELSRVENVRTEQDGFLPTIFNYGHVHIETAGVDSNMVFENVRNPRGVQNQIFSKRDKFNKAQDEARAKRQLDQNATLLEMYEERRARGMIPEFRPLPEIDDE